jgi:hypothetical protein
MTKFRTLKKMGFHASLWNDEIPYIEKEEIPRYALNRCKDNQDSERSVESLVFILNKLVIPSVG